MGEKDKGGRPRIFKTVDELQERIDKYFKDCEGKILLDDEDNPILDKRGNVVIYGTKPLTITGLALAIGLQSRQALLNYEGYSQEFNDAITRAKSVVEAYTEARLFDKEGSNGAKFSLTNNYKGWRDKQEIESKNINLDTDITGMTKEEIEAELEKMGFRKE